MKKTGFNQGYQKLSRLNPHRQKVDEEVNVERRLKAPRHKNQDLFDLGVEDEDQLENFKRFLR